MRSTGPLEGSVSRHHPFSPSSLSRVLRLTNSRFPADEKGVPARARCAIKVRDACLARHSVPPAHICHGRLVHRIPRPNLLCRRGRRPGALKLPHWHRIPQIAALLTKISSQFPVLPIMHTPPPCPHNLVPNLNLALNKLPRTRRWVVHHCAAL